MDIESNKMNMSGINNINATSPIKQRYVEEKTENVIAGKNDKTHIQLDDFFEFLDSKTIQRIMQTPEESKVRIVKDVIQREYDTDGAKAILDSLG